MDYQVGTARRAVHFPAKRRLRLARRASPTICEMASLIVRSWKRERSACAGTASLRRFVLWRRLGQKDSNIAGCFGFDARFLQKSQIAEPIDKTVLPGSEREVTIAQACIHARAVTQRLSRMPPIAVNVHLD